MCLSLRVLLFLRVRARASVRVCAWQSVICFCVGGGMVRECMCEFVCVRLALSVMSACACACVCVCVCVCVCGMLRQCVWPLSECAWIGERLRVARRLLWVV